GAEDYRSGHMVGRAGDRGAGCLRDRGGPRRSRARDAGQPPPRRRFWSRPGASAEELPPAGGRGILCQGPL
ncbi:MAG: hypothetical protein AVDCRST_MAG25-1119, partial [uncultured Rubrobacteraceae bacterium]